MLTKAFSCCYLCCFWLKNVVSICKLINSIVYIDCNTCLILMLLLIQIATPPFSHAVIVSKPIAISSINSIIRHSYHRVRYVFFQVGPRYYIERRSASSATLALISFLDFTRLQIFKNIHLGTANLSVVIVSQLGSLT